MRKAFSQLAEVSQEESPSKKVAEPPRNYAFRYLVRGQQDGPYIFPISDNPVPDLEPSIFKGPDQSHTNK
jgi:hypothetical protein